MSLSADLPERISPDDALPPVEPPDAGFIIKLFVIPLAIVSIIGAIVLTFNWLAHGRTDPDKYIRDLERNTAARWQSAMDLANLLRDQRNTELKTDSGKAQQLIDILQAEFASGKLDDDSVNLRRYLCNALGEFRLPAARPVLLTAATTRSAPNTAPDAESIKLTLPVRLAALKALFVSISNIPDRSPAASAEILPVLVAASRDERPDIRAMSAFALRALGGDGAVGALKEMLGHKYPGTRYDAATNLANLGDAAAVGMLREMLESPQIESHGENKSPQAQAEEVEFMRGVIQVNALRATAALARLNPQIDLGELEKAISSLLKTKLPEPIRVQATEVSRELQSRAEPAKG